MYWQSNFDAVMSLMQEATEQGAPAFLCTVRGSVHLSQSDFSLLYPHLCSLFLKATGTEPCPLLILTKALLIMYCMR
jgi:platelet-activating factor acetylhydrolase